MRAKTLQISWHADDDNKNSPILSVDFHPTLSLLVTGGADNEIKVHASRAMTPKLHPRACVNMALWRDAVCAYHALQLWELKKDDDPAVAWECVFVCSLTAHQQTVNAVRWSPDGEWLWLWAAACASPRATSRVPLTHCVVALLCLSHAGRTLASVSDGEALRRALALCDVLIRRASALRSRLDRVARYQTKV